MASDPTSDRKVDKVAARNYSDSASLSSDVTNYRIENGRRYHAYRDGAYWGPNDEAAADGQDLSHAMYNLTLGGLYLAPICTSPTQILDVGTGTGIWAIEMADMYPDAQVTGTDLSPIQPEMVPPNCVFEVDDCEMEWTWEDGLFDFVHVREMFGSIRDWDGFLREAFRCMKGGGWVEVVEHSTQFISDDDSVGPDHMFTRWGETVRELGRRRGKTFDVYKHSKALLEEAGFVDVVEKKFMWPSSPWPKDEKLKQLGEMNQMRVVDNLGAFGLRLLTDTGGWKIAQTQLFLAEMRRAIKDPKPRAYLEVVVAYGRKPTT